MQYELNLTITLGDFPRDDPNTRSDFFLNIFLYYKIHLLMKQNILLYIYYIFIYDA